jgi:hypothetical protein
MAFLESGRRIMANVKKIGTLDTKDYIDLMDDNLFERRLQEVYGFTEEQVLKIVMAYKSVCPLCLDTDVERDCYCGRDD